MIFVVWTCLLRVSKAQQVGTLASEQAPGVVVRQCERENGCVEEETVATLDANWRWTHEAEGSGNCFTDGEWSEDFCQDAEACAAVCAIEGVTAEGYANDYGVEKVKGGVELKFVSGSGSVGSRLYLSEGGAYKTFRLKNREFTFDVDVSRLPCGMNGAVYFVEMDPQGDKDVGNNTAGAALGTGYCDAQCPHDIKWIKGRANVDWSYGSCCIEMDIWEANRRASAHTPHPCVTEGAYRCKGKACGDTDTGERYAGVCDKDGCDFNPFRMGRTTFYGEGADFTVDTSKPLTVVTQFITADGSDDADLFEIRRLYVQSGRVIALANSSTPGVTGNTITDEFCEAQKEAFSDINDFKAKGGMKVTGEALDRGMVLALSIWDDKLTEMRWLDSIFPPNETAESPGAARGPCDGTESNPDVLRSKHRDASVTYTNIMYGEIGSTFSAGRAKSSHTFLRQTRDRYR